MLTVANLFILALASGIMGLWGRALLLDFGIIKGFDAGLWACVVIAAVYGASQMLYRALLLLIRPTRAVSFDVSDMLSHASALVLLPSLLGFRFHIPYPTLEKLEPLAHLAVFGVLLVFFRLMTFFAAVYGEKSDRSVTLRWALYALLASLLVPGGIYRYLDAVAVKREIVAGEALSFAVDNTYTKAYGVPENKRLIMPLDLSDADQIAFLCAPRPDEAEFPESVYVIVESYDRQLSPQTLPEQAVPTVALTRELVFSEEGWTPVPVSREEIPPDTVSLTVSWMEGNPEGLRHRLGVLPPDGQSRVLMVSGPWAQKISRANAKPSVVILLAEGMGAENMGLYGYERNTTPNLARCAADMIMCEEVYTPTPETPGAVMSLLTGLSPLSHGYPDTAGEGLPGKVCSIAEVMKSHGYFTVAFTEGQGVEERDLVFGSGLEKGFILFDDHLPLEVQSAYFNDSVGPRRLVPAGSRATLEKAGDWIAANADVQYFVFVRLRELSEPRYMLRYGMGFMKRMGRSTPMDVYDTALAYMDRQLGAFFDRLSQLPPEQSPIVILTSTNGFDFREWGRHAYNLRGEPRRSLHESALRVPLLIRIPGCNGQTSETPASLIDVAPTLAALTGTPLPYYAEGANLLEETRMREIISVMGDPVEQSMRSGKWRFTWQSGLSRRSLERVQPENVLEFIDIARYRNADIVQDNIRKEPQLVDAFKAQLSTALHDSFFGGAVVTMNPRTAAPAM